jgi:hypothetical protein
MPDEPVPIYLEVGKKKVFACAVSWAGWCRAGKTEDAAIEMLGRYGERYSEVARRAGLPFLESAPEFEVVERVEGNATTDFGAPGVVPDCDRGNLDRQEAFRSAALLGASWAVLDDVVAQAPAELRKGPRGGGRDRDKVFNHVIAAEAGYARAMGRSDIREPDPTDREAVESLRSRIHEAIATASPPPRPKSWPWRYAARRIAWHALDHAWEIQDRST